MEFIEADNPEWCEMWETLSNDPINHGDAICANFGKAWEYMGSTEDHHCLRHLKHPHTLKVEYAYIERKRAAIPWARLA